MNGTKTHGPYGLADLLEAYVLGAEEVADENLAAVPADGRILGDEPHLEMGRVLEWLGGFFV